MKSKHMTLGLLFVVFALLAAACSGPSRAASTPVTAPGQQPGDSVTQPPDQQPAPTDAPSQVETLMAGDLATATALAGGEGQPAETQTAPTAEPIITLAPAGDPTAVPTAAPTSAPQPTNTPKPAVDCSSPYTVKKGDWVWDIGRRCNIHPNSIIAANGLVYPYIIYPGNVLVLPTNAPPFPGP